MFATVAAMALSASSAQQPAAAAPATAPAQQQAVQPAQQTEGYTCPMTGEELPCPNCCPLKK